MLILLYLGPSLKQCSVSIVWQISQKKTKKINYYKDKINRCRKSVKGEGPH